jgi:hypothetical protein
MQTEMVHFSDCALEIEELGERPLDIGRAESEERDEPCRWCSDDPRKRRAPVTAGRKMINHVCSCRVVDQNKRLCLPLVERYWPERLPPTIASIISI